jgi:hypothetical protein
MRIFPSLLKPVEGQFRNGRRSSQRGPGKVAQFEDVLAAIPSRGITIDDLMIKIWKRPLSVSTRKELIRILTQRAIHDPATGLYRPRPKHNAIPGPIQTLISRPTRRKRVSPFASDWISGKEEVITHVRGDYNPVCLQHEVRGVTPTQERTNYKESVRANPPQFEPCPPRVLGHPYVQYRMQHARLPDVLTWRSGSAVYEP